MSTVFVIANVPDSIVKFRSSLITAMVSRGHRVVVCASATDPMSNWLGPDMVERITKLGAEFMDIPLDRKGVNPVKDLQLLRYLVGLMRREKPDVILNATQKPVLYGSMAAGIAKVPRCHSMITGLGFGLRDEADQKRLLGRVVQRMYRVALRSCKNVIFQNPDDLALFRRLGLMDAEKPTVIVNGSGVDTAYYEVAPLPPGDAVFLLTARLLYDKGIREYVEAARKIHAAGHKARFLLVGPLEDHPFAVKQAELDEWVAEGTIEWLGKQMDVRPALRQANVYVLPSYREGTPRTVLEAMSMGRPIVTTDVPGCRETVVNGDNGFLVEVQNSEDLARGMTRFIVEPELRTQMGEAARRMAERKYAIDIVNGQMLDAMGLSESAHALAAGGAK